MGADLKKGGRYSVVSMATVFFKMEHNEKWLFTSEIAKKSKLDLQTKYWLRNDDKRNRGTI